MAMTNLTTDIANINKSLESGLVRVDEDKCHMEENCRHELQNLPKVSDELEKKIRTFKAELESFFTEKMVKDLPTGKTACLHFDMLM